MTRVVVVGAGPAGLMAAEVMARAGVQVSICEAKPSVGRKFLMAGKSGLNLTKSEDRADFLAAYTEAASVLHPMLEAFGPEEVMDWAEGLGQPLFTGSTGRVFPEVMKASPLLRAWMRRLSEMGVTLRTRWRMTGLDPLSFDTPEGIIPMDADAVVLALGGASWARLGSDGAWANMLTAKGVPLTAFAPANAGVAVLWSAHMSAHFGAALKNIALSAGPYRSRGEAVISEKGLEGGGIYSVSRGLRDGHPLVLDLMASHTEEALRKALAKAGPKASQSNRLRKAGLDVAKIALLNEMARPLPHDLAPLIKALPIKHAGLAPMDDAISVAGGIAWEGVDAALMLKALPGVFVAGEMLDWEAPTGGYLINGCLATGAWAGQHAARYAAQYPAAQ